MDTNLHLSLTNPFREFPLFVVEAFPPKPTIMAVIMALLPPSYFKMNTKLIKYLASLQKIVT